MMEKWKANMNNLLIFVGLLPKAAFLVLTSVKAALFTGIVTAFVLDAMSDLDEDTATALLRVLVEQSITNSTIEIPSSNPPSSTLTVISLWFLSIMFSLAATTWAMLCLEWCAFLPDGVQAEDYEEMAEKRQRRFEAMKRWKVHFVVSAIPLFLHLSLFLFLVGLWLRLRDVNKQLGLIVGASSLVIVSSYVMVTLLPIFTDAPFPTSASELILPVVDCIRLLRFIRPPRLFSWIAYLLRMGSSPSSLVPRPPQSQDAAFGPLYQARPPTSQNVRRSCVGNHRSAPYNPNIRARSEPIQGAEQAESWTLGSGQGDPPTCVVLVVKYAVE